MHKQIALTGCLAATLAGLMCVNGRGWATPAATLAVSIDPTNPHYFLGMDGLPLLFLSHASNSLNRDGYDNADWQWYLDQCQPSGLNLAKLLGFAADDVDDPSINKIQPWKRVSGAGSTTSGNNKWELDQFNDAYFNLLSNICSYAQSRGVYLQIQVWNGLCLGQGGGWDSCPYDPANTATNTAAYGFPGVGGDGNEVFFGSLTNTAVVNGKTLLQRQEDLFDRVVNATKNYPNVFYELGLEIGPSTEWAKYWVDRLRAIAPGKLMIVDIYHYGGDYSFFDGVTTHRISYSDDSWPETLYATGKMGIEDSDYTCDWAGADYKTARMAAWVAVVSGTHWTDFRCEDFLLVNRNTPGVGWANPTVVAQLKNVRRFFTDRNIPFTQMSPNDGIGTNGVEVLAGSGRYVAYTRGGGFNLTLASGTYTAEWYDPRTGASTSAGTTTGGGSRSFTPPDGNDWVLYLKSTIPPPPPGNGTGLKGEYFDNMDFTAYKQTRTDATVNFDWGAGSPDASMGSDTFSVRWSGQVQAQFSETYTFTTVTDDGVRLWVNGVLLIDKWIDQGPTEWSGTIALVASQKYDLKMEYYENAGGAVAKLLWSSASTPKQTVPQSQLYPATGGGPTPYGGTPWAIPGTIEAENFDNGGEGVAYHDQDATNNGGQYRTEGVDIETCADTGGGYNVGWIQVGEWLLHTVNVAASGTYTIQVRVASNGGGGTFHIEFGGVNKTGTLAIPDTGGWQAWTTLSVSGVSLSAGQQVMRVEMDSNGATGWVGNINYVSIGTPSVNQPPSVSITNPTDGASFAPGATMNYSGSGNDPEDGTLPGSALSWALDRSGDGLGPVQTTTGSSGTYTFPSNITTDTQYTLTLTGTDSGGLSASKTITVWVRPGLTNSPPAITSGPTASPNPATVGQSVNFSVSASDANGDPLTYSWNFGDGANGSGSATTHIYSATGTYVVSVTVSDGRGGTATGSVTVSVGPSGGQSVTSFTLVNADTDGDIGPLNSGDTLNLATLPTRNLNVRANTSPATVGSVRFGLDGTSNYRTENSPPYALAGDSGGNYAPWTPAVGTHTLSATPYTGSSATGTAGTSLTISFAVTDGGTPFSVSIDFVSTGKAYSLSTANVGALYYIDRSYTISSLSAALNGQPMIRTANDDKNLTATTHLTFTVSASATVYVCYDKRASQVPAWLNDGTWTLTGETFTVTDGSASPMRVYSKSVGVGQVTLGGNKASPAGGAGSNYGVVVRPQ